MTWYYTPSNCAPVTTEWGSASDSPEWPVEPWLMLSGTPAMRADEAKHGERIRHPYAGFIVTVDRVTVGLSWVKVYFRSHGTHGSFKTAPQTELEDCT